MLTKRITMNAAQYLALLSNRPIKRLVFATREVRTPQAVHKHIHVIRVEVH